MTNFIKLKEEVIELRNKTEELKKKIRDLLAKYERESNEVLDERGN